MTANYIKEAGKALADFYIERPIGEAREILQEAFKQLRGGGGDVHAYAELLREYATFLESCKDWMPDKFREWKPAAKPFVALS